MGSEKSAAVAALASAHEADRRIAGVAAAARAVRELVEAGHMEIRLEVGGDTPPAPATLDDIERVRGPAAVAIARIARADAPYAVSTAWEIVRRTGKPGDGLVSRWINRPVSQRITLFLLHVPGVRPVHVTIFNALLAIVMAVVLLAPGGETGLMLGALLFQSASILDGVDGEIARATYRSSRSGAALDSAVDMATNLLFLVGITVNLALRDGDEIGWIGGWAILLVVAGAALIGGRARAGGAPLGFDLLKRSGRVRGPVGLVFWVVQTLSSRDCFAFLFLVLIIAGLERTALTIFSSVATLWFLYLLASLFAAPAGGRGAGFRGAA